MLQRARSGTPAIIAGFLISFFGGSRVQSIIATLKVPEDEPINARILSNAIESAQTRVEGIHYQSRKSVLEYDDVMNHQRELIYGQRMQVLDGMDVQEQVRGMVRFEIEQEVHSAAAGHKTLEKLAASQIAAHYTRLFIAPEETTSLAVRLEGMTPEEAIAWLQERANKVYNAKEQALGAEIMRELERVVLLRTVACRRRRCPSPWPPAPASYSPGPGRSGRPRWS